MPKLKSISREEALLKLIKQKLESIESIAKKGSDGRDGVDGRDGRDGKDGVTTVVKEQVLLDDSNLVTGEEFEKFKRSVEEMQTRFAAEFNKTSKYFSGGYPVELPDKIQANKEEIDELAEQITELTEQLIAQGGETQLIIEKLGSGIEQVNRQLRLLNARTEEGINSGIGINDLNELEDNTWL